jgi:hypothetical protein
MKEDIGKVMRVEAMIRCPCGQWVMVGTTEKQVPGVIHDLPMCSVFVDLGPLEFLTYLRKCYEAAEQVNHRRFPRKRSN